MNLRRLALVGLLLPFLALQPQARNGDNRTPKSIYASAIESYLFQSPDNGWPEFLTTLQQQGYIVQRFKNEVFDDDPESATVANLVQAAESGVLGLLHIHGNTTGASLEVYEKANRRDDAWDAYIAAGWNAGGELEIAKSDFSYFHNIRVQNLGFRNRVKPRTDPLDTLIYGGGVCNSIGFVDDMGGRTRFGNDGLPNFWFRNLAEWMSYLGGASGEGEHRPAGEAIAEGDYDEVVRLVGDGRVTLCPSVMSHGPTGTVSSEDGTIEGLVTFDTRVSATSQAIDALNVSVNAEVVEASWADSGSGIFFALEGVEDGDVVTMSILAEEIRSAANDTELDGNQLPEGTDGTLPNGDDFVWSFDARIDRDGDGIRDGEDNCRTAHNPDQEAVAFDLPLVFPGRDELTWGGELDVEYVRGDLTRVDTYGVFSFGSLSTVFALDLSGDEPAPNAGIYYLVRHDGLCGTWQNEVGAEPGRDAILP